MAIFINKETRVLVQGITGQEGQFHTRQCRDYGTRIVAGVTPGKGGQEMDGIPVFNSVAEARRKTGANASMIVVREASGSRRLFDPEPALTLVMMGTEPPSDCDDN